MIGVTRASGVTGARPLTKVFQPAKLKPVLTKAFAPSVDGELAISGLIVPLFASLPLKVTLRRERLRKLHRRRCNRLLVSERPWARRWCWGSEQRWK